MTIHVPIGEAEKRLSELVAAAVRGEDVVLDRAGAPQVRLVTVAAAGREADRRAERRRGAIGIYRDRVDERDIDVGFIKSEERLDEHFGRKFADPD